MRSILILIILLVGSVARGQVDVDQIVKEVHAKRLIEILGEVEDFRNVGRAVIQGMTKEFPDIPPAFWARVGYEFNSDAFEAALTKHYAASFTSDELTEMVKNLDRPRMRGLVFWLKKVPPDIPRKELDERLAELAQKFGPEAMKEMGNFTGSALFRQLLYTSKSADKLRKEHNDLAFNTAMERARSGLLK